MATKELTLRVRGAAPGIQVIDIEGEITGFSEQAIAAAHEEASEGDPSAVILNFENLTYMNSGGIGLLVTSLIRARRAGHRLVAFGLAEHYREIFALTRLDEAIAIFHDEPGAIAGLP